MLKVLQISVVLLGVAFFLALAGLAYYASSPPNPIEHQAFGDSNDKQPQSHTFGGFIHFLFPDAISIFTFWLFVATIVLGVAAYVQISFLGRAEQIAATSADAAKQAAVIAERALVAGQRAFVHLEGITFEVVDNWVTDVESGQGITVYNVPRNAGRMIRPKFSFTNSGNTPTKMLRIMLHCGLVSLGTKIGDPFDLVKLDEADAIHRSIGAKQTITISVDSCNLKNNDVLLNAQMQIIPVFLIGELRYEDWIEPGRIHRTQFAHRLIVYDTGRDDAFTGMSVATEPVGSHNCTDEDCPN